MKKSCLAVLTMVAGAVTGAAGVGTYQGKIIKIKQKKVDKFKAYYNLLNQWLILKQDGKNLEQYFIDNQYETIAIYGMGEMGNRLYDELKNTSVKIEYAIDKEAGSTYSEIEVLEIEDNLPKVDAVIVTAVFAYEEVEKLLSEKIDCNIISLEEVVYEV